MTDPIGSQTPRVRSRGFYVAVLAIPVIVQAGLVATGRAQAYVGMFWDVVARHRQPPATAFSDAFITAIVGLVQWMPLLFAAWEIGRQHAGLGDPGREVLVGLREVVRIAFGREPDAGRVATLARPPADRPGRALALGIGLGALVPTFFMLVIPGLRTPAGAVWLGGTGILMGASAYCRRRAEAYLVERPGRWDPFRQWRRLNPNRYAPEGRRFVRWGTASTVAVMLWWLGGGAAVMSRDMPTPGVVQTSTSEIQP